jgi:molecular chaperone GrpE
MADTDEDNNNNEDIQTDFDDLPDEDIDADSEFTLEREDEQPKDTIKRLRDKLKECTAKKQEYLSGWQRAKADLVNAKKEFDRERERIKQRGKESVITDLLPALDSFAMAMADTDSWEAVDEEWRTGVEQIHNQLLTALEKNDVVQIKPGQGDEFDPQLHSSVDTEPTSSAEKDNTIASCEQTGYRLDDRVIRSAQVVVYQQSDTEEVTN